MRQQRYCAKSSFEKISLTDNTLRLRDISIKRWKAHFTDPYQKHGRSTVSWRIKTVFFRPLDILCSGLYFPFPDSRGKLINFFITILKTGLGIVGFSRDIIRILVCAGADQKDKRQQQILFSHFLNIHSRMDKKGTVHLVQNNIASEDM